MYIIQKSQQGFTLIELVLVIVIIGVLSVFVAPKFVDLKSDATQAVTDSLAGSLTSASSINYLGRKASNAAAIPISNCSQLGSLLQGGAVPTGYAITPLAMAAEVDSTCEVKSTGTPVFTAVFSAVGVN